MDKADQYSCSRLKNKVAIVTASTDGIGYAIAERLGSEGASIIVSSRKEKNVQRAVKNLRNIGIDVEGVVCHVGDAKQRKNMFEVAKTKYGGFDILVSNAAVNPGLGPILEVSESQWDKIFEINTKSSWLLAKEAYSELVKRGGGSIVFVSTVAAYIPLAPVGAYSVSKLALIGLTKSIASEVTNDNIRVNCVASGMVRTKFGSVIVDSHADREKGFSHMLMKRLGKPSEIAAAVAFLVSDDASFMTGDTLIVTGGTLAHL